MKILIYDCEIIKAIIPDYSNEKPLEGIEYCESWDDFDSMGISVIGTYNNWNKEEVAFVAVTKETSELIIENNYRPMSEFQVMLDEADVIVGFNNQHFDDNLIKANGFVIHDKVVNYDILVEMWKAAGIEPPFIYPTHAGYSLKQTCKVNGLSPKTDDGGNAAIDWQRGKYKEVIDYCLNDVKITTELFRKIMHNGGWIENPKTKLKLRTLKD